MEKIQGQCSLGDVTVPKVHGEAGVVAAYACDEVLLEGAKGFLGMVCAVAMRREKLEVFIGFGHEFLDPGGVFIVKDVQGRLEATQTEVLLFFLLFIFEIRA